MSNRITQNELFPQFENMTEHEKLLKIARHLPCDACACQGWRPFLSYTCACGHEVDQHVDNKKDWTRRFKVALRIEELLENFYNAQAQEEESAVDFLSEASSPSSVEDRSFFKRNRDSSDEEEDDTIKRFRTDFEEEEDEEEDEEEEEEEEEDAEEEKEEEEEEEEEDEEDEEVRKLSQEQANEPIKPRKTISSKDFLEESGDQIVSAKKPPIRKDNGKRPPVNNGMNKDDTEDMDLELDKESISSLDPSSDKKETPAMAEERLGLIEVRIVENDNSRDNMILLTGLKNIFQKQLPKMPKEYIARLVYDRNHRSIALIRKPMKVIGGICYRPFNEQEFAEIVFCAIASTEQVKGYGSFLMSHLKDYISEHTNMKHYLTYADNYATGYFRKQGFTTEITLDKRKWVGYIKDYEGGTIMQCTTVPKVKYLKVQEILAIQKNAVYEKMKEHSTSHIIYPGIQMPMNEQGRRCIDPFLVPGVKESGWTPEMDALSNRPRHQPHYNQMRHLMKLLTIMM
ncbi:hypothetical protein G6F56_008168 [Rhizopus delemar]|nr:hypothetical protein G6F56_008168 [Rhizopus delemar]